MMSKPFDRPTSEPGGMQCERCDVIFVGAEWHSFCAICAKILDGELPEGAHPTPQMPNGHRESGG